MSKKSQIKMMETISVLVIFLIIMTFVLIFYVNMSVASRPKAMQEKASMKAIEISQIVSNMPEFQCSSKNIIEENCYDLFKIKAFLNYTKNTTSGGNELNTTYYDIFKNSKITLKRIYPINESEENEWVVYERDPLVGVSTTQKKSSQASNLPISLYNPQTGEYYFGMLRVDVYSLQ